MPSIQFGTSTITYRVRRKQRKTLAIHVHPDCKVVVDAPVDASLERIAAVVGKRGAWILRQQRAMATLPPPQPVKQFLPGATIRYLGRQYRLRLVTSPDSRIKVVPGYIEVSGPHKLTPAETGRLVNTWLDGRAREVIRERYLACVERLGRLKLPAAKTLSIRRMRTRWGSCSKGRIISLNPELIYAPKDCIDYVITHELCHLREMNHGIGFNRLMDRVLPDWKALREKLNRHLDQRLY
ncbi:MAG: M48 family metallopeptidase [Gammaproteobacteria bacterium]